MSLLLRLRPGKFYCCTQRRADPLRKTKNDPNSNTRQMSMSQAGQIPISLSLTLSRSLTRSLPLALSHALSLCKTSQGILEFGMHFILRHPFSSNLRKIEDFQNLTNAIL